MNLKKFDFDAFYGCPLVESFFVEPPFENETNNEPDEMFEVDEFLEMNMEVEE